MAFVNRENELGQLERWWDSRGGTLGMVWGRRRVGKTALIQHFAGRHKAIFLTASGRPESDELGGLRLRAESVLDRSIKRFEDWPDAIETLAKEADSEPLLLVLDEFPELVRVTPGLPASMRSVWDSVRSESKIKILLCGSAVRTMQAVQEERSPLYGRLDLSLLLHQFRPSEASKMLPELPPTERALVYGLVGGVPLYLEWWDQRASVRDNLLRLACSPAGLLLREGELALATEGDAGDLARQTLYAIARGRTKHNEIQEAIRADPSRTLDRLLALRLVERVTPVTEDPHRTRRRVYRIADNFLAFWLGLLDKYRSEIERGLGESILSVLIDSLDDHLGWPWEEAFRMHLRLLAEKGELRDGIVAIGPFWLAADDPLEIDAIALAGREGVAVLAGEAKWKRRVDGDRIRRVLEQKIKGLPKVSEEPIYAVAAREQVTGLSDVLAITAADIFP